MRDCYDEESGFPLSVDTLFDGMERRVVSRNSGSITEPILRGEARMIQRMRDPEGATACRPPSARARRSLSRYCEESPESDEPNTREGVRKTANLSLPEGCRGFPGGKRHQGIGRCKVKGKRCQTTTGLLAPCPPPHVIRKSLSNSKVKILSVFLHGRLTLPEL